MDRLQAEQIALSQLDPGERLLWSGTPAPHVVAMRAWPATLVGIPFVAFAMFWMWSARSMLSSPSTPPGPWMFFPLFGVPFVIVGLAVLAAPLWVYLAATMTVYAVTDRRALIIVMTPNRNVQSYSPDDIGDIARVERSDGSGSVFFATRAQFSSRGLPRQMRIGFEGIPDVRHVEQLIRDQIRPKAA